MKLEIDDELAKLCGIDLQEAMQILAIGIYKKKGIHGALAGKLLGVSEFEFHQLLSASGETVNYDFDDLVDDIKSNHL